MHLILLLAIIKKMRKIVVLLLLLLNQSIYAHEDIIKVKKLSNLYIKVEVGYESSLQLDIINSYAELINDFICEIDSSQKVFLQFEEDYCYDTLNYVKLSYETFEYSVLPYYAPIEIDFKRNEKGLVLSVNCSYFKIKPVLQLIEFGLENLNYIETNQILFKPDSINAYIVPESGWITFSEEIKRINSIETNRIDSIIKSDITTVSRKYLSQRINIIDLSQEFKKINIDIFFRNDSLNILSNEEEILKVSTIDFWRRDTVYNGIFIFNTNSSFYYLDKDLQSNGIEFKLSYEIGCLDGLKVLYSKEMFCYKMIKTDYFDFGKQSEIWDCFYPNKKMIRKGNKK